MKLTRYCLRKAGPMLDYYSQFHPSVLSIQQFLDFAKTGDEKTSYLFLRRELPVRLANIMKEINLLPTQLLSMPSVQLVESWYQQSFKEILQFEKASPEDSSNLLKFCETLSTVRARHINVVETMAQGVLEMKETHVVTQPNLEHQVQYFLDRFYLSRISIRMVMSQHVLLFGSRIPDNAGQIGGIDPYCSVLEVAQDAYDNARFLCEQYYMVAPECDFIIRNPHEKAETVTMTYVPSHLHHMLFELLKNSMRAVVEHHQNEDELPNMQVMICKGREDLTIKVSDQGGGICRSEVDLLFNYMFSTAPRPPSPQAASSTPLAGYGYGLPLSRLYAKYFNGDLRLHSVEGYGTDATVYLKVFPQDACEFLPVFNKTSLSKYNSVVTPISDWSDPTHHAAKIRHVGPVHTLQLSRAFSTSRCE